MQHKLRGLPSGKTAVYVAEKIIASKKQRERESTVSIIESLKDETETMCYLGHWTKQKRLRFVLLRFFLSFSFLSLIGKGDSICGRMPLLILFSFFLYLFLKCTLEDSDEAGGGEDGPPLSLILTIVSIC